MNEEIRRLVEIRTAKLIEELENDARDELDRVYGALINGVNELYERSEMRAILRTHLPQDPGFYGMYKMTHEEWGEVRNAHANAKLKAIIANTKIGGGKHGRRWFKWFKHKLTQFRS